jgi:hypothetical protein
LNKMTESRMNRFPQSTPSVNEAHKIEVVWCAMREHWQGLALKLLRWIDGSSMLPANLCFIRLKDSILSCQFSTSPLMSMFQTSNSLSIQKTMVSFMRWFHHGASSRGSRARNELQHALLPGDIPQMYDLVEMCRCAFSTFCEMHCPNQLGLFKLRGKHWAFFRSIQHPA